ncbi:MAG: hypothetical protein ACLTE2_10030 [Eubacteriales bacterium]
MKDRKEVEAAGERKWLKTGEEYSKEKSSCVDEENNEIGFPVPLSGLSPFLYSTFQYPRTTRNSSQL